MGGLQTAAGEGREAMSRGQIIAFILITLVLRFFYGLGVGYVHGEDHEKIYALGLKYYTTGEWPYFGPDVVYTQSQIPGALQSLWIALPLKIFPYPEAPFVLLVLAVVGSLSFLSWYLVRLQFSLPPLIIWIWVATLPWSFFFGSTLINPGYVMIYAIFFMVAFYEITCRQDFPAIIPRNLCYFILGFTTLSIAQLHLSWVLLLVLVGVMGIYDCLRVRHLIIKRIGFFFVGCLMGGATLFPTLIKYGVNFIGGSEKNITFNFDNYKDLFKTLINFLYFSSYQVVTSMNLYSFGHWRQGLFADYNWAVPFFVIPFTFGVFQMGFYALGLLNLPPFRKWLNPNWSSFRKIILFTIGFTWLSFFFNDSGNSAHKYFLFFPLMVIHSIFVLEWAWKRKWFRSIYWVALATMLLGQVIIAYDARWLMNNPYHISKVREKISRAIEKREYTLYSKTRYDHYVEQSEDGKHNHPGY